MWFDRITAGLRRLYGSTGAVGEAPAALERALLERHATLYPAAPVRPWLGAHRWAIATVTTAVAAVVACQVPVDYERAFGASVGCELSLETWSEVQLETLAQALAGELGADRLAIRAEHDAGATRSFRVDLWGAEEVPEDALIAALQTHAPQIPADACSATPLAGTVHGTLGGRLGYRLFDLELDDADADETRRRILEELARQGLEGSADVEVRDDGDGKREVKIRIEAYHPDHAGAEAVGPR